MVMQKAKEVGGKGSTASGKRHAKIKEERRAVKSKSSA